MKADKRKHKRAPVVKDLAEPVELFVMDASPKEMPAILTNLSAGGMSMVVFAHVKGDTKLKICLNVPGLEGIELEGHVAWTHPKGDTTTIGVKFSHVSHESAKRINSIAEAYQDCELKISFGVKDVCFRECPYHPLCHKPYRLKH